MSMRYSILGFLALSFSLAVRASSGQADVQSGSPGTSRLGDEKALSFHIAQNDINDGKVSAEQLLKMGAKLFGAKFTTSDGIGRPGSTGSGLPTRRPLVGSRHFLRTSGPDATSCAGCHHQPTIGGGGEFASNVFVGAQEREPVLLSISQEFSAERGTTEMHGAGLIELLAREMTADLHQLRHAAREEAQESGQAVRIALVTKEVAFGWLTAHPNGEVETSEVEGVDRDLVIRPWSQRGVVTSLRTFTVTALNHHHGMQAVERYGVRRTGTRDFDRDGIDDELTEGDITALVLFQALLAPPGRHIPSDNLQLAQYIVAGEEVFTRIGCGTCHRPAMVLNDAVFVEPGPYNLEGTLRASEVPSPLAVPIRNLPWAKGLEWTPEGGVVVRAFTDLKRHRIADAEQPFFANETVTQGFAPTDEFLTRRLWAVGNSSPYGHRGDVTTLDEVIRFHGGEATGARLAYERLPDVERHSLIEFLKSLRAPTSLPGIEPLEDLDDDPLVLALRDRWYSQNEELDQVVAALVSRARAASQRSFLSSRRSRIFALRAVHESAASASSADVPALRTASVPELSADIRSLLSETPLDTGILELLDLMKDIEAAAVVTRQEVTVALVAARTSHPGPGGFVPAGRLEPEILLERLRDLQGQPASGRQIPILELLVEWCEDLSFRIEQLTQQAALAATRAEAEPVAAPVSIASPHTRW